MALCSSSSSLALSHAISNRQLLSPTGLKSTNAFPSLKFSSSFSGPALFSGFSVRPLAMPSRRPVVFVVAVSKKPDSAAKRARQAEKRRIYNKSHKSEIKTRMRKVFEALGKLKKATSPSPEDLIPIEKLIAEAYSSIDKAVKVGTLHRNTGGHRKSRLSRRKKVVEIHHGWYKPAMVA
uniref:Small ribosomal subunit protein bS20c n=1 Tax=Picea sitchensis TaxID=3332 RepID=A9NTN6_PICSI|nr:unknown [Picea sitchensis]ABK26614.1 unknown [Picea sitchensis]